MYASTDKAAIDSGKAVKGYIIALVMASAWNMKM